MRGTKWGTPKSLHLQLNREVGREAVSHLLIVPRDGVGGETARRRWLASGLTVLFP